MCAFGNTNTGVWGNTPSQSFTGPGGKVSGANGSYNSSTGILRTAFGDVNGKEGTKFAVSYRYLVNIPNSGRLALVETFVKCSIVNKVVMPIAGAPQYSAIYYPS